MRYGHGHEALIESRISKTNSILVQLNQIPEKKLNSLSFSDPRLNISEFYRQTLVTARRGANISQHSSNVSPHDLYWIGVPVFFIAFFLYKLSTTAKYVDKKQNNTFLNLKHSIYREGNTMCFPYAVLIMIRMHKLKVAFLADAYRKTNVL